MNVWAISDLHLSFARPDPRERYAARWKDHATRIEAQWREVVKARDLVLLPGDLSMARNHRDLQPDLLWLARLPGIKVLAPGNHDAWWNGVEKIRPMLRRSILAVGGDSLAIGGVIVCGARSSPVPPEEPSPDQAASAGLALAELRQSLEHAVAVRRSSNQPLYLLWHHPPFDAHGRPGPWVALIEQAGVSVCVYGHLHIEGQWSRTVQGRLGRVRYYCVASDAVGFRPLRLDQID